MTTAASKKPINNNGIHQYLAMKRIRSEATYRICCDGSSYWILNGHQLTENQFNDMLPIGLLPRENKKGSRIGSTQQIY